MAHRVAMGAWRKMNRDRGEDLWDHFRQAGCQVELCGYCSLLGKVIFPKDFPRDDPSLSVAQLASTCCLSYDGCKKLNIPSVILSPAAGRDGG